MSVGCGPERREGPSEETRVIRPLNEVLAEHSGALMKIDGVVGVYEGALENGEPCIVVMLRDAGPEKRKELPGTLEGYPVRLEIGGEIRPLRP
jgi:hypothetical protein